jgi:predicted metal-dependent hydrolase
MQLSFFKHLPDRRPVKEIALKVAGGLMPLRLIRNERARRYVLRLMPDGAARVTIPRSGTIAGAREFAERNAAWLDLQRLRNRLAAVEDRAWRLGDRILFRGEYVTLQSDPEQRQVRCAELFFPLPDLPQDLRPAVEWHLRRLAKKELPAAVMALAAQHGFRVDRVTVRNQKSRWGSCSRSGRISLNWRLVQMPPFVRDYVILHELAHLRHMNHSSKFWNVVRDLCPQCDEARRWLRESGKKLK